MEENNIWYTVTVFTEDQVGLMSAFSSIFTRRQASIWSISASPSAIEGIHKLTLVTCTTRRRIEAIVSQLEKKIEVIKAFYYTNDEIIYRELALYKIPTDRMLDCEEFEDIISEHKARVLEINRDFAVIQRTGTTAETQAFYDRLNSLTGVLQFVRSGRVSVTRDRRELLNTFIKEREAYRNNMKENKTNR